MLKSLAHIRSLQLGALTALFIVVGTAALRLKYFVIDSDIWWHLKVGDWIVEHLAVPHTGILSRTAATRPWVAYSWGYEVLLSRAYAWFGLIGIGVFGTLLTLLVALAIYWMLLRLSGRFWIAWILTGVVCWSFLFNGTPRPFFFSIALFAVTLTLLLEAGRGADLKKLYWLPLIFFVWANLHIQFIYGLFLVGLFMSVSLARTLLSALARVAPPRVARTLLSALDLTGGEKSPPQNARLIAIFAACVFATLLGPYFYHPYVVVFEYSKAKFTYSVIVELQPLSFRYASEFLELLLAASGFFALGWQANLGRARHSSPRQSDAPPGIDLFKLALLTAAVVVAFRTMRDAWFICLPAAACIAEAFRARALESRSQSEREQEPAVSSRQAWLENLAIAAAVAVCLIFVAGAVDFNERGLDRAISADYPVNAINFLRRNPVRGPIYNNLNWGGFLMWYMPDFPVAIDGRNDLYGDDLDKIFYSSESAQDSYKTDPYLDHAGFVLLDSKLPLAKVLTIDPRFDLIYHDEIATVFARR
ncbi:MAG: hypothetical protein WBQ72_10770 [Terriglobales bacterium]|jgi:hypothetical protein